MESPNPEWVRSQALAAAVSLIQEAVRRARSHDSLVRDLASFGIEGRGGRPKYSDSAIRSWLKGQSLPSATVVFALALHYGLRVDTFLWQDDLTAKVTALEQRLKGQEEQMEELQDATLKLLRHTGLHAAVGQETAESR